MTEKQKRYKILKRESYQEQISQEDKNAINSAIMAGFTAAGALCIFPAANSLSADTQLSMKLIEIILGILEAGFSAYNLKGLIEAICKKTMLQSKVEDINTELEMLEDKESRGMRR